MGRLSEPLGKYQTFLGAISSSGLAGGLSTHVAMGRRNQTIWPKQGPPRASADWAAEPLGLRTNLSGSKKTEPASVNLQKWFHFCSFKNRQARVPSNNRPNHRPKSAGACRQLSVGLSVASHRRECRKLALEPVQGSGCVGRYGKASSCRTTKK